MQLVQQFPHNVQLWTRCVALATSILSDSDEILTHVHAAIGACSASKVSWLSFCIVSLLGLELMVKTVVYYAF